VEPQFCAGVGDLPPRLTGGLVGDLRIIVSTYPAFSRAFHAAVALAPVPRRRGKPHRQVSQFLVGMGLRVQWQVRDEAAAVGARGVGSAVLGLGAVQDGPPAGG